MRYYFVDFLLAVSSSEETLPSSISSIRTLATFLCNFYHSSELAIESIVVYVDQRREFYKSSILDTESSHLRSWC